LTPFFFIFPLLHLYPPPLLERLRSPAYIPPLLKGRLALTYILPLLWRGRIKEGEGIVFIGSNVVKLYKLINSLICLFLLPLLI